ncbi:phage holin family protein [Aeromicrobium halocynthiae]|uniref:Phage holin family protein n=1 Tax=Aeromicrobium halocynthiae TaxID=560557 RepID=A0ABN2W1K3_9ACTN
MTGPEQDRSTGEIVANVGEDIATIVRTEIALAKDDLARSGKRVGIGVGAFGAAGVVALYGLGALVAAAVLGLSGVLEPWLAALVVAAVLFVVAGVAALVGKRSVSTAGDPPKERVESVQEDVAAVKGQERTS